MTRKMVYRLLQKFALGVEEFRRPLTTVPPLRVLVPYHLLRNLRLFF